MRDVSTEPAQAMPAPPPASRLALGGAILALGILAKIGGPALIVASDLPTAWKTGLSIGVFVIIPKLMIVSIIMLLGKSGFAYLKSVCFSFIGRVLAPLAPARKIGRMRHRIGVVMFVLPLIETWLVPYVEAAYPAFAAWRPMSWAWDVMLIASFFVLGGDFWDKFRALFIRGATATFPVRQGAAA
ncbi:MAG: hypothetical protein JNL25_06425 [Rhodospirillaceae bacterium]|nr:hypothetical protein [Rhodospirillaceae bacterium]